MSTLWLVRHGQASFLEADYDRLSQRGEEQAVRLGEHWADAGLSVDRIVAGPRRRQVHTAEIVRDVLARRGRPAPEVESMEELDEYRSDELFVHLLPALSATDPVVAALAAELSRATERPALARAFDRALQHLLRAWIAGAGAHLEMESWAAFEARIARARARLLGGSRGANVVAVSSGGAIGAFVGQVLEASAATRLELGWTLHNAGVVELFWSGARTSLSRFNAVEHLPPGPLRTHR